VTTGRRLTVAERDALERDGYLLVASLLDGSAVDQLRAHLEALVAQEVAAGHANYGDPGTVEAGVVHAKLEPADPGFRPLCEHRLLADAAVAVLGGPWHMSGLGLRAPLPGCGHQGWHPDFGIEHRSTSGPWRSLSAMWCITAFTADNGSLRVIPGSHRVAADPVDVLAPGCEMGPHPDEVKIVAPAGSVILFNGADLWHSGTFNYSMRPRLAVTASFAPGDSPRLRLQISSLSGCRAAALTIRITALILGRSGRRFSGFPRVDLCCPALCGDTVGSAMGSIVDRDLRSRRGRFETISPCRRNAGQRGRRWPVTDRQHTWFTDRSGTQRARPAAAVSPSKCFGAEPS